MPLFLFYAFVETKHTVMMALDKHKVEVNIEVVDTEMHDTLFAHRTGRG